MRRSWPARLRGIACAGAQETARVLARRGTSCRGRGGSRVWGLAERRWRETIGAWLVSGNGMSPYQTNPLGINPLRQLIAAHIDIDAIRTKGAPALYVTVTNVRTGLPRVISNHEMTVDVLLASACLPQLFQAVEIDGEPYWDGGYSGNPTLWPLIEGGGSRDLIVVQLTPDQAPALPKDSASIHRRIDEIVFASSLVAQMQAIAAMRAVAARSNDRTSGLLDVRLHRIGPPPANLTAKGSPMERSRAWLESSTTKDVAPRRASSHATVRPSACARRSTLPRRSPAATSPRSRSTLEFDRRETSSAKANRFVPFVAPRTNEQERLQSRTRNCELQPGLRRPIEQPAVAFEPDAVAVRRSFRRLTGVQFAPAGLEFLSTSTPRSSSNAESGIDLMTLLPTPWSSRTTVRRTHW